MVRGDRGTFGQPCVPVGNSLAFESIQAPISGRDTQQLGQIIQLL